MHNNEHKFMHNNSVKNRVSIVSIILDYDITEATVTRFIYALCALKYIKKYY